MTTIVDESKWCVMPRKHNTFLLHANVTLLQPRNQGLNIKKNPPLRCIFLLASFSFEHFVVLASPSFSPESQPEAWHWASIHKFVMLTYDDIPLCFTVKITLESVGSLGQLILKSYDGGYYICLDDFGIVVAKVGYIYTYIYFFVILFAKV